MTPAFGIDARNLRRQRFSRSKFAGHLRTARDIAVCVLICDGLIFAVVGLIWFINSLIER